MADVEHAGAAKRRRERRLRQWLRHERMTVAMAVAEATHHSAPRRQKTATAIREVEEQASHDCLRAQTALPPGARPGILAEPGPQRSDRTVRHSAGEAPLLVVASLAGGDEEDVTTAKFLLRNALRELEEEENLEERRKARAHLQAMTELVRRRKRKKRRKKKTPKSSSFRSSSGVRLRRGGQGSRSRSCARPCDHQRQVLAVHVVREIGGAPVPVHRQSGGHSCFMSMDLADAVLSGKYSGNFVFTAPVAEPTVMSFTVPLNGCTIVATDGAYDSVWDSVRPMIGKYIINYFQYQEDVGCVCMLNGWFSSNDDICPDNYNYSGADEGKIHLQFLPVPRGRWVRLHAQ